MSASIVDQYPLSPVQQGILFDSLRAPGRGLYIEQPNWALRGRLNVEAFRDAWAVALERHQGLRAACWLERADEPLLRVHRNVSPEVVQEDWRGLPRRRRRAAVLDYLARDRARGFELDRAPLMRIILLRLEDDLTLFIWSHHHVLTDGWSASILLHEVFAEYGAQVSRRARAAPPAPPYRRYVEWLQRQDWDAAERYWRRTLAGFTERNRVAPGASPRTPSGRRPGWKLMTVPSTTSERLRQRARAARLTLNTLIEGAMAILISRWCGSDDVLFGTVSAGRPASLPDVEKIVGPFIGVVPVRVTVEPPTPLLPWLQRLQRRSAEAREHGFVSLAHIRRWSDVPFGEELVECLLTFQNYPGGSDFNTLLERAADLDGFTVEDGVLLCAYTPYPVDLIVLPSARLVFGLQHDTDQLDDGTADRLLAHLGELLERLADNPPRRLGELP